MADKITLENGQLAVSNHPIIPFIEGDGVGRDIWKNARAVFDAAVEKAYQGEKKVAWHELLAGKKAHEVTGEWLPKETLDTIKEVVNAKNCDYGAVLKNYRKSIVQKISRLQGLLGVVDGMQLEETPISFKAFHVEDAKKVTETIVSSQDMDDSAISEIGELVKSNMVDGKVGIELLQIYGSREKYLSAVEESAQHPEVTEKLQEELKNIYFSFMDSTGENGEMLELVTRLEDNTKKMYRTANARYILLKIAEGYLANDKTAQVLDFLYGAGVTAAIGKAIKEYYGDNEV